MKFNDLQKRKASHVLLFGGSGAGKSTLMARLALQGYKLWWFSVDNGHTVLEKLPSEVTDNIEIFVLPSTTEFPVGYSTLLKVTKGDAYNICDNHGQVECDSCKLGKAPFSRFCGNELGPKDIMIVDHMSVVAQAAMGVIAQKEAKRDPKKALKEYDDIYKMTEPDWGTHWGMMDKLLTNIQFATWNICAAAHALEGINEDNSKSMVPLLGTRNFSANKGSGYWDHVIYASVLNKSHKFGSATTYMMNVITKSRTDVEIEKLENPTLVPFFDGTVGVPVAEKAGAKMAAAVTGTSDPAVAAALASLSKK